MQHPVQQVDHVSGPLFFVELALFIEPYETLCKRGRVMRGPRMPAASHGLSARAAATLLAIVVVAWGTNWPVTKMIVHDMSPLWSTASRCAVAAAAVVPLLWATGNFIIPRRGDMPVVLSTGLLHMAAFSALVAAGLQFVPAGRAIVLGYTTPIWVAVGARIFLSETITKKRAAGIVTGLAGLAVIFYPGSLGWGDR